MHMLIQLFMNLRFKIVNTKLRIWVEFDYCFCDYIVTIVKIEDSRTYRIKLNGS